jgi:hypothetical protein
MELDNKKEESIPALSINTPLDHHDSQQDNPQSNETGGATEISQPISTEVEEKIPEEQPVSISNFPATEENPSSDGNHLMIPNTQVTMPIIRRSARGRIPKVIHSMLSVTHPSHKPYEPTDYQDAVSCKDAALWREKMDEEIQALTTKKTWILVPLPPGRKSIKCMFVYKYKPGYEGVSPRRKVRLVAKGYSQLHGIDYTETFAPVVKMETFRVIVAFAVKNKLQISSLDVWVAFLNGDLQEEIYMDLVLRSVVTRVQSEK